MNPPPPMGCNVVRGPAQNVSFSTSPESHDFDLDESCTVTSVSATKIELDCETFDSITIDLDLAEPWTPNFETGATLHLVADADNTDWWEIDWRLDHADQSLAIAGRHAFYYVWSFESLALGTIPVTVVSDACVADCSGEVAPRDVGLTFEFEGEQSTLFTGGHSTIAEHDVWVTEAYRVHCNEFEEQNGHIAVFVSGKPAG